MNFQELKIAYFDCQMITPTSGHVNQVEAERHLNEAQREIHNEVAAKFAGFFETSVTLSEVSGAQEINLPTNLLRIDRLQRVAGYSASLTSPQPMERVNRAHSEVTVSNTITPYVNQNATGTYYNQYYPRGQKQVVLVVPAQATRADSLRLFYTYRCADMTADANVPFQAVAGTGGAGLDNLEDWHHLIWMRAALKGMAKEDDTGTYKMHESETNKAAARMWELLEHLDESPRFINIPEDQGLFFDG